jgi:protein-disulfide isomerase
MSEAQIPRAKIPVSRQADPFSLAVPVDKTDHILGPHTAEVTLVEYGDYECPNCNQAYPAAKLLLEHFGR